MDYSHDFDFDLGISFEEDTIEDVRENLNQLVEFFKEQDYHSYAMECLIRERMLPASILEEQDVFFVDEKLTVNDLPDWMLASNLGFVFGNNISQIGRFVYPVKDVKGNVMGLCGWDPFIKPKYLDSKNYGYIAKSTSLFGMEKISEYYSNNKPVFVTEGIVCCLYLRSKGYQALALLGSHMSKYVIQILKRFGNRLILVPDNDGSGDDLVKQAKYTLKKAFILQVKYGKDIDGCRKVDGGKYEDVLLSDLANMSIPFYPLKIFLRR